MTKTLYVLGNKDGTYLDSKTGLLTKNVQKALRAVTSEEAEGWKQFLRVPSEGWVSIPIQYETLTSVVAL